MQSRILLRSLTVLAAATALLNIGSAGAVGKPTTKTRQVCAVATFFGTGTLNPDPAHPAEKQGAGFILLEAFYDKAGPTQVSYVYLTMDNYQQGASTADVTEKFTVNGVDVRRSPHIGSPPDYEIYSNNDDWVDQAGARHTWHDGDSITIRINVAMHPTNNSGWTEATCKL